MNKSLDTKLDRLKNNPGCQEFILADAKDADMAFGLAAPGQDHVTGQWRTISEYRDLIRQIVEQGLIDISLMSVSNCEELAVHSRLFDDSPVTPAIRANDSTDIWLASGTGRYSQQPSLPFRSANLDRVMGSDTGSSVQCTLGLYSITLNNDAALDRDSLNAYADFRREAADKGFRHFLEVFPPNAPGSNAPNHVEQFLCDSVVRTLAGMTRTERPLFLKLPFLGREFTEKLIAYDSSLVVGIMGGAAGTTHDAFSLLAEAKKCGVRAALFGRRINHAECQLGFVQHLRWIADGELEAREAVVSYHAHLERNHIVPRRTLQQDLERPPTGLSNYQDAAMKASTSNISTA